MKYFYAYFHDGKEYPLEEGKFDDDHIFVDRNKEDVNWTKLVKLLKRRDIVYIPTFDNLASDDNYVKPRLEIMRDTGAVLSIVDGDVIEVKLLLMFMEYLDESKRKRAKELQRKGIDKALEKKYKGEGNFGRPKVKKPKDFKENILKIMRKELSHDTYRAKLGMKRSTYYKLVKEEKDSWTSEK